MIPLQPESIDVEYRDGVTGLMTPPGYWWRQDGRYPSMPDAAGSWETPELAWAHARLSVACDQRTMDRVGGEAWSAARAEACLILDAARVYRPFPDVGAARAFP